MTERRRFRILDLLGLRPTVTDLVRDRLDTAFAALEPMRAAAGETGVAIDALDAGCGRLSALTRYRSRIRHLVGADLHRPPPGALPYLDSFLEVDLCAAEPPIEEGSFDLVLSSFTAEHFWDPPAAFRNMRRWLRPGGRVVLTTVNRRHPFVAAYLGIPQGIRRPLQTLVKASKADAHPLVGVCNDPTTIRAALAAAGFVDIRVELVPHLARAWGRRLPAWGLGLIGDLAAQPFPNRRSTIIADAKVPD